MPQAVAEPRAVAVEVQQHTARRSRSHGRHSKLPTLIGVAALIIVVLVSAGVTVFFLTKPADDQRLFQQGQRELAEGQYAFAVKSLEQAVQMRPQDPRVYLALARAYVGVDEVDKAWQAISQAQQLGTGVIADPTLASDLANYYRQHQNYERAAELLRPLASADMAGKKAELADLDAMWGDQELQNGNLDQALKCWEEVRDIHEGARVQEADARLATIYQKIANNLLAKGDQAQALNYLNKLNTLVDSAPTHEKLAQIYEQQGQLELAIDQMRRAIKMATANPEMNRKLASLMMRRGKEMLDAGDAMGGYGYMQEAKALDPENNSLPNVMARAIQISVDPASHNPQISGEIWNPGSTTINDLSIKVSLVDALTSKSLWDHSEKLVDEFVAPLVPNGTHAFSFTAPVVVKNNASTMFQVYLNDELYKNYPVGQKTAGAPQPKPGTSEDHTVAAPAQNQMPPTAPDIVPATREPRPAPAPNSLPPPSPAPAAAPSPVPATPPRPSSGNTSPSNQPEDQTLKDLEL